MANKSSLSVDVSTIQERIKSLPPEAIGRVRWKIQARPEQLPPLGDWFLWLVVAGRGFGKTRLAAEWLAEQMVTRPMTRWAIISPTYGDGRDVCVQGESGLLEVLDQNTRSFNRTLAEVTLKNGSRARVYPAITPDRLRGPQFHGAWLDEPAAFRYGMQAWDTLQPALRLGIPKVIVTGTPAPVPLMRYLMSLVDGERVVATRGRTMDNAENLPPSLLEELQLRYAGTRLGRQELEGELLEDVPGALWTYELATRNRVVEAPDLERIVVSVDPAVTSYESSNETGIIVAGKDSHGTGYVLADRTMRGSPLEWARRVIAAYYEFEADAIVVEVNQGGEMVSQTIRTVDDRPRIKTVTGTRGKAVRAEPIVALYEQNRVFHVGIHKELEDQMASWVPGLTESPDRVDALVWAFIDLMERDRRPPAVVPVSMEQTNPWKPT